MKLKTSRHQRRIWWKPYRGFFQQVFFVIFILCLSGFFWTVESAFFHRDELRVWFFDIGQGDATFIETPDGHQILIDGGPGKSVLTKLGEVMLPWDRTIDVVVATHPDADHIGGLASVLERYEVNTIVSNGDKKTTDIAEGFLVASTAEEGADRVVGRKGMTLSFGEVLLTEVWPTEIGVEDKDANIGSIVYRLDYKDTSILFTGDATEDVEAQIIQGVGNIDVLKVGHHGSITSSSYEFLASIDPEFSVISCGVDNRYGHPHPLILKRFSDLAVSVFRTDQDGDVLLTSDGGEPVIRSKPLPF